MSGLNSLSGLNNVNVDFRPTIELNAPKTGDANQPLPGADAVPVAAPQPEKTEAKSVVRQLDVLLLGAAGKSVSSDAANNVTTISQKLVNKELLTEKEASKLESLATDAAAKLKALDKFSGRELATALMKDEKTGEAVWSKGFFFMNSVAKAVKSAIEAQQTLSAELGKFNRRLAQAAEDVVDAALQDQFTELQFQCDRRASEIDSIVFRMYCLTQQDVVNGAAADPQTKALLDATFKELMPREAIMMHGTKEAFEKLDEKITQQMRPLVEKLDAFRAGGAKVLNHEDILALQRDMATMKNAIANVRENGIKITHPGKDGEPLQVTHTEVDKSLLDEMDKLLDDVSTQIDDAKNLSVKRSRQAFLEEMKASLSPENAPGGEKVMSSGPALGNTVLSEFRRVRLEFVTLIRDFAAGDRPMDQFDADFDKCIAKFNNGISDCLESALLSVGIDAATSKSVAKMVKGLNLVKAQFKELMRSSERLKGGGEDPGLATSDVRRIMLGEVGLSNVIEAKARGFKPGDVDPAAEESNIVSSKALGSGVAGKTYLLTTKSGQELVFKPELDSRIGLSNLALGTGNAYIDKQNAANLNLATQDTAKAFGCEDLVVKCSVGSHDGQFGLFMEKAKGYTAGEISDAKGSGGDGIAPDKLFTIRGDKMRANIQGQIAQKLNKLMWLDLITGQGDRHWNNYFVCVENNPANNSYDVTVKAIDNDASFSSRQVGLQKYALDKKLADRFDEELKNACEAIHGEKGGEHEYNNRVAKDVGITKNDEDGSMTIDLAKAKSPEVKMALIQALGMQSTALPEEIDEDFYNKLMEMDANPDKKKEYLESLKPRISAAALKATENRLNEAIEHAKKLSEDGKVYKDADWKDRGILGMMPDLATNVKIKRSDGNKVTVNSKIACVRDFFIRECPSIYKRDFLHLMFQKPQSA